MPQSFRMQMGPVTVTVEGVPDSVRPESLTVDVNVFSHYAPADEQVPEFRETFRAMGGNEEFKADGTEGNSVRILGAGAASGAFLLFIPDALPERRIHPALYGLLGGAVAERRAYAHARHGEAAAADPDGCP